jgi:Ni,Fe-hydrogenase maturation factor
MTILGIGNVLQKDDGIGVYAATYLKQENRCNHIPMPALSFIIYSF